MFTRRSGLRREPLPRGQRLTVNVTVGKPAGRARPESSRGLAPPAPGDTDRPNRGPVHGLSVCGRHLGTRQEASVSQGVGR